MEIIYEDVNEIKESKISMLVHVFEMFKMESYEYIFNIFSRFTNIINDLTLLGKSYANVDLVRKILWSLLRSWKAKVIVIQETKDLN